MSKQVNVEFENVKYVLEFNRNSAAAIEKNGFDYRKIEDQPNVMIPLLVHGAFRMHHPTLKPSEIDKIYNEIPNKVDFVAKLAELYAEPLAALFDEAADEGNATWGASW